MSSTSPGVTKQSPERKEATPSLLQWVQRNFVEGSQDKVYLHSLLLPEFMRLHLGLSGRDGLIVEGLRGEFRFFLELLIIL